MTNSINKKEIESLLPHRDPMLLIDELIEIKKLKSATGIVNVKKNSINIVLDKKNVIIGKKNHDITFEILELVNANIK